MSEHPFLRITGNNFNNAIYKRFNNLMNCFSAKGHQLVFDQSQKMKRVQHVSEGMSSLNGQATFLSSYLGSFDQQDNNRKLLQRKMRVEVARTHRTASALQMVGVDSAFKLSKRKKVTGSGE